MKESHGSELGEVVTGAANHGQGGPDEGHQGEPDARGNLLDDKTVRDLTDDVFVLLEDYLVISARGDLTANSKTGDQKVVLVTREVDVFLHSRDVGISQHSAVCKMSVKRPLIIGDLEGAPR